MPNYDEKFFETASSEQLRQFRNTLNMEEVSADQLRQLDDLIVDRKVEERMTKLTADQQRLARAKELDAKAYKMWPELKDKDSEFYQTVNAMLEDNGDDSYDSLLNAANAVGLEMGLQPAGVRRNVGPGMEKIKGAGSGEEPDSGKDFLKRTRHVAEAYKDLIDINKEGVAERIAARAEEGSSND